MENFVILLSEAGNFSSSEILVLLGQNGCGKAHGFLFRHRVSGLDAR